MTNAVNGNLVYAKAAEVDTKKNTLKGEKSKKAER